MFLKNHLFLSFWYSSITLLFFFSRTSLLFLVSRIWSFWCYYSTKSLAVWAILLCYCCHNDLFKRFLVNLGSVKISIKSPIILHNLLSISFGFIRSFIFEFLTRFLKISLYLLKIVKISIFLSGFPNVCLMTCLWKISIIQFWYWEQNLAQVFLSHV